MAQITGAMSGRIAKIEYSTNFSTYTDLSGGANSINVDGGDRQSGETYTFDGDKAVIGVGKLEPAELTIRSLYVDSSAGHFAVISAMKNNATPMNVRFAYDTDTTGSWRFTADTGYVISCKPPQAEAGPGDPLAFEWTVKVPGLAEAVVA
jgi:hypothetical protein